MYWPGVCTRGKRRSTIRVFQRRAGHVVHYRRIAACQTGAAAYTRREGPIRFVQTGGTPMGTFRVDCQVEDHLSSQESVGSRLLVNTVSEHTWIPAAVLRRFGSNAEEGRCLRDGQRHDDYADDRLRGVADRRILYTSMRWFCRKAIFASSVRGPMEGMNLRVDYRIEENSWRPVRCAGMKRESPCHPGHAR